MSDPRFISPSDRELSLESIRRFGWLPKDDARPLPPNIVAILAHATFMDERDARQRDLIRDLENTVEACEQVIEVGKANETRQRDLIRLLAEALDSVVKAAVYYTGPGAMEHAAMLVAEARGIEATNE